MAATTNTGAVLLYDGECGFCNRSVQTVLRHDSKRTLRFAALSGDYGRSVIAARPELRGVDSMVWVDLDAAGRPQHTRVRSAAALRIARYLGGAWALAGALWIVPAPVRDAVYDWVARHRKHLIRGENCLVLSPDERRRFLDAV